MQIALSLFVWWSELIREECGGVGSNIVMSRLYDQLGSSMNLAAAAGPENVGCLARKKVLLPYNYVVYL